MGFKSNLGILLFDFDTLFQVNLEPQMMEKLLGSGLDFAAPPTPLNILGVVWTVGYAFFLWKITSRMLQGPSDEGAGKNKDKKRLQEAYGDLSFNDVAGQDQAKLEVQEVCQMLRLPSKYASVGRLKGILNRINFT